MKLPDQVPLRVVPITAVAAIGAVALFLLVQDARNAWPFSPPVGSQAPAHLPSSSSGPTAPPRTRISRTTLALDAAQFERMGVRFEPVRRELIAIGARAVATVAADERRLSHVHTRVAGWVETLYINATGEAVRAGQPLAEVFSQELFASQNEYLTALRQQSETPGSAVPAAARTRLAVLGMTDRDIAALERRGTARRLVTIVAPRGGIVLRRGVTAGTAIDPSTELLTIADLEHVWVLAELPEADAPVVQVGAQATLAFPGSGRAPFTARVEFIYPTLTERTRAVRVRFTVPNEGGALRPGLYGAATFASTSHEGLTVARDAVVDTGESQHVFVRTADDLLEPRRVQLGARLEDRIEVQDGLAAGEEVVTAGVFLIDSESRLRASGGGTAHGAHGAGIPPKAAADARAKEKPGDGSGAGHTAHGS